MSRLENWGNQVNIQRYPHMKVKETPLTQGGKKFKSASTVSALVGWHFNLFIIKKFNSLVSFYKLQVYKRLRQFLLIQ